MYTEGQFAAASPSTSMFLGSVKKAKKKMVSVNGEDISGP